MSYKIKLTSRAEKDLTKLDKKIREQIVAKLDDIKRDPRHDATQLKGEPGTWRRRAGNYRIIYQIKDKEVVVTVIRIGHRSEVYDR